MGDILDNIYKPGPLAGGGASILGALLGGGAVERAAKQKEEARLLDVQGGRASVDEKITKALLERDKRTAQQNYKGNYVATGVDPLMAQLMADANIGGAGNLVQAQQYDQTHRAEAALAADTAHFTPANAILGALAGKPIETDKVEGGYINHNRFGAAPTMDLTALTQAQIANDNASARQHEAAAGAQNAHAGVYDAQAAAGGYNPHTGSRGAGGTPAKRTEAPIGILAALLDQPGADGTKDGKLSATELAPYQTWRTLHPDYLDGNAAATAYGSTRNLPALNPAANDTHMTIGGNDVLAPAGTDPQLVADLFQQQEAAKADGNPLSIGTLRAMAEVKARGHDYTYNPDTGVRVIQNGPNTQAVKQPAGQAAKGNQPSPLAPHDRVRHDGSVPPVALRKVGQKYPTPKGMLEWTGSGWLVP